METKTYWVIKTIRNTYIRQTIQGDNLSLIEYDKDRIVHADFYEDVSTAATSMGHLISGVTDFLKSVDNQEEYPLLKNMGLKIVEVDIRVEKIGN